jgi:ATP-dependent protease Clp ATPase subunit
LQISDKHRPGRVRTGLGLSGNTTSPSGGASERGDVYSIDTSNILFIFCGAFTGLEKIVETRLGKRVT